jgi:hypothetical protein
MARLHLHVRSDAQEPSCVWCVIVSCRLFQYEQLLTPKNCSGMVQDEVLADPQLGGKRSQLATIAGKRLAEARMIAFDTQSGSFTTTDLGRIAAKYYIRHASIEVFNKEFRPRMTEADVLAVLSKSTEVRGPFSAYLFDADASIW